jgi:hypothetical protein
MTPEMQKIKPIFMPRIWLTKQKVAFLVRKYGGAIYEYMDVREHVAVIEKLKERENVLVEALEKCKMANDRCPDDGYVFSRVDIKSIAELALSKIRGEF